MKMTAFHILPTLILTSVLAIGSCNKSEPPSPVPPPPPFAAAPTSSLPAGHPPVDMRMQALPPGSVASVAAPQWVVPDGWQAGSPSSMRKGSFTVNGPDGQSADVAVTAFPGDVGGMLNNINRWRGQIGLAAVAADQAGSLSTTMEINRQQATVVDMTAEKLLPGKVLPQRIIAVTIPHGENSWFFKMTGDARLVEAQKEKFFAFVKSATFEP